MSDLDKQRVEHQARQHDGGTGTPSRYGDAVNRYLSAVAYREREPLPEPVSEVAAAKPRAGVVVVGVDETPTSYTAVDHAAIEAELRGWDLRLVHAQRAGVDRYPARDVGARLLQRMTDRVHAYSPSVAVTSRIVIGPAVAPLLLSDAHDANLLVVGHRHNSVGTAFGLSVGDRVAAHDTGPVLVVRVPGWPPGPDFGVRPVVVGVDDSPVTKQVVDFAIDAARLRGSDLIILHAGGAEAAPEAHLEESDGVRIHRRVVTGDPVPALITASENASAVVVGRRGMDGILGALLGSVSRAMVQHARCPVFLVG